MKNYTTILLILACWVMAGCQNARSPYKAIMGQAEQLMETAPDSAYLLLQSLEEAPLSHSDSALFLLLRTEAEDKLYVKHTTDSLIAIARDCFEQEEDLPRLAKAWYLTGRIHSDWKQWEEATQDFLKAQKLAEKSDDHLLKGRIAGHLGNINWQNLLYLKARKFYYDSFHYYTLAKDTVKLAYSLKGLGETYMATYQADSAILLYKQALSLAETTRNKRLLEDVHDRLGYMYKESGENDWAIAHFRQAIQYSVDTPYYTYKNIGALFIQTGQLDSARHYLEQVLLSSELSARCMAYYFLSEVAHLEGDDEGAFEYKKQYEQLSEIFYQEKTPETVSHIQQKAEQETKAQSSNALRHRFLWGGMAVGVMALFAGTALFFGRKRRGKQPSPQPLALPLPASAQATEPKPELKQPEPELEPESKPVPEPVPEPEPAPEAKPIPLPPPEEKASGQEVDISLLKKKNRAYQALCRKDPFLKQLYGRKTIPPFTKLQWRQFAEAFDAIYPGITEQLKAQCPKMSPRELQTCQITLMEIKVNKVADVMGIQSDTVSSYKQKAKSHFKQTGTLDIILLQFIAE